MDRLQSRAEGDLPAGLVVFGDVGPGLSVVWFLMAVEGAVISGRKTSLDRRHWIR